MYEIYSTDTDEGTISVIQKGDAGFQPVARIPVGNAPRGSVRFTSSGRGYVSNCGGDTISEIDLNNHREIGRIKVGPAPRGIGIVPGDRYALVSNSGSNTLSVVDLQSRSELYQLAVGRDPRHMGVSADGKWAYVAIWGSHCISKIDISSLSDTNSKNSRAIEVRTNPLDPGSHPYSVAIHKGKNLLLVAATQSTKVPVIDLASDSVIGQIDIGSKGARAIALSTDGRHAFVTIENTSQVAVLDIETLTVVGSLPSGAGPRGIAIGSTPAGAETLFIAAFERTESSIGAPADSLTVIDVAAFRASGVNTFSTKSTPPGYDFVSVGKGSCSVSIRQVS